ncbi:sensor histidine kinase [Paenibacillus pini]|uniref:Two-component sensor kinase YesM n=1 Tax=Paenibacillus pini JCM 16418 TaxID=1236976 RepID=W7YJ97_9BACL|nr:sensor histidine kinase [Paenibacillus pini]GAF07678.1 two-component sensor kinase YesM [Paenibacillus pini JCM 16418]
MIKKSIKNKIILSFLLVLILPTTIISITSYRISVNILEEKLSDSFNSNLSFIGDNIEKELEEWEHISKFINGNPVIRNVMMTSYGNDLEYYYDMKRVDQELETYSINTNIFAYVSSLVILGNNGRNILYGEDANSLDLERIKEQPWFKEVNSMNGKVMWLGIHKNIANYRVQNQSVVALGRAIKGDKNNKFIGTLYLTFKESYFTGLLKNIKLSEGGRLYIVDNLDHIVFDSENKLMNEPFPGMAEIREHQNNDYLFTNGNKEGQLLLAQVPIKNYDWRVIETIPYSSLKNGTDKIFKNTIGIFLISFIITSIIWLFVSSHIVSPIRKLTDSMKKVQEGDLTVRVDIERPDEVGIMNKHFNFMIKRIQELFHSNLEEQEKKKNAEYKALQAQINPHFLYNTLNTIRWMAIIQKSDNIREVVEVLGRLLKNTIKHDGPFVRVEEELSNLKDYVYIQKIRYNNNFDVKYDIQDEILAMPCVKFILQPIVENAIFHGIEPKEDPGGEILISMKYLNNQLMIRIRDNGVGMSNILLEELNHRMILDVHSGGIGMMNVKERLKLTYGEESAFIIRSEKDIFTEIEMIIPVTLTNIELYE